jgi:enoyl-CoA hydratase
MVYENILVETRNHVGVITLNREKALNALSAGLIKDLGNALAVFDQDNAVRVVIITGSDKAFAAGADIKEMADKTFVDCYLGDFITEGWEKITKSRKPKIAAVAGYALGGGCEVAMMCDIIIAAENAKFGQPEITLGIIPGSGGTQRLTRIIGKSKAMDMILTGRTMDANEAERSGLVARVVSLDTLMEEALKVAEKIAHMSLPTVLMAKESVNRAYESSLNEGLLFERRMFHASFALEDQKEGMSAFIDKRQPTFKNR